MSIATEVAVRELQAKVFRLENELESLRQAVSNFQLAGVPRGTDDKANGSRPQKR